MKAKEVACMFCNAKNDDMRKYRDCGSYVCDKCLDSIKERGEKTFECKNCTIKHLVTKRAVNPNRPIQKPKERRSGWVLIQVDEPQNMPKRISKANKAIMRSRVTPAIFKKYQFDHKKCLSKPNVITPTKTFQLNDANANKNDDLLILPLFEDKILLVRSKTREYSLINQNNEVIKSGKFTQPGEICRICANNKFIYTVSVTTGKAHHVFLCQYDIEFNFIEDVLLEEEPCYGIACTDDRLFFTSTYGYEWNPHPCINVYDAEDLELLDKLTYEMDSDDDKKYCLEKLAEPPSLRSFQGKIYCLYDEIDRIDIFDADTLRYESQFDCTPYFFNFKFDNGNGNFIYIDLKKNTINICDHKSKKVKNKLQFSKPVTEKTIYGYCITNDGHLFILNSDKGTVDIY